MSRLLLTAVIALLVGIGIVLATLFFLRGDAESISRVYGDWKLTCVAQTTSNGACALTQNILQSGSGATLVHLEFYQVGGKRHLMILVPFDVLLQPGLGFGIENASLRMVNYETCNSVGCIALMPIDDYTLCQLRSGDHCRIVVEGKDGKPIAFPCSLRGFDEGIGVFTWESLKRNTWMGRFLP